nr:IS200/IS605 family transposase [Lachnospiraceae bacterium]
MEIKLEARKGYIYNLTYHLAWCTMNRQTVFTSESRRDVLKDILYAIAEDKEIKIQELDIGEDYIHLIMNCRPQHYLPDLIKSLKGGSAKKIQIRLPELQEDLQDRHVWDSSYLIIAGNEDITDALNKYITIQHQYRNR